MTNLLHKVWLAGCLLLALGLESSAHAADGQALRFHEIAGGDGTPLNVVETGNATGPAVVLLHGFSQSYLSFALQLHDPELNKRFRLIAIDLRGHGGSGKPWAREAYAGHKPWAQDLRQVVDALKLDRPIIVGWSFGGYVAMDYVREYGAGAVEGLVLTGSHGGLIRRVDGPPNHYDGDLDAAIENARHFMQLMTVKPVSNDAFDRGVFSTLMMPAYVRNAMVQKRLDNTDMLATLAVRTLVILGEKDGSLPAEKIRDVLSENPNISVRILPAVGHSAFMEAPEIFDRELLKFATDHEVARNAAQTVQAR